MFASSGSIVVRLTFATSLVASLPFVDAAEVRTYEFLAGQERGFAYSGGLAGDYISARLAGSFDVEIADDGFSRLTRFDVQLFDVLDQSLHRLGPSRAWPEGTRLADILFVIPVGLTGRRDGASITLGEPYLGPLIPHTLTQMRIDDFPSAAPGLEDGTPNTIVRVNELGQGLAEIRISSLPEMFFDSPSFNTRSPGLLASVVPEPASWMLVTVAAALGRAGRRWRSSWH